MIERLEISLQNVNILNILRSWFVLAFFLNFNLVIFNEFAAHQDHVMLIYEQFVHLLIPKNNHVHDENYIKVLAPR